jgi:serine protease Do
MRIPALSPVHASSLAFPPTGRLHAERQHGASAKIIGRDPRTDIAVLKVGAGHPLSYIQLGDSAGVKLGEWVVAVGDSFGLGGTVTAGIVSAVSRDIGDWPYNQFIQIDAPINEGNSGGPLFTQDDKVIGMNTAILSPSDGPSA